MHQIQNLSPHLTIMTKAAQKAARRLLRDFGEVEHLQTSLKGPGDFVSAADLRAEQTIKEELMNARKDYSFLMEESGEVQGENKDYCWIIDPLDGTQNFLHALPYFAISIALREKDEIIAGVIYAPILDELFYAEKGRGAFLYGSYRQTRLRVSARKELSEALIVLAPPHRSRTDEPVMKKFASTFADKNVSTRRMGSTTLDLAYVAAGRFDGILATNQNPWDVAAGLLMIKEAGGFVVTAEGKTDYPSLLSPTEFIGANQTLQQQLKAFL